MRAEEGGREGEQEGGPGREENGMVAQIERELLAVSSPAGVGARGGGNRYTLLFF